MAFGGRGLIKGVLSVYVFGGRGLIRGVLSVYVFDSVLEYSISGLCFLFMLLLKTIPIIDSKNIKFHL